MNWCETEKTKGEVIELTSDVCGLQSVGAERLWIVVCQIIVTPSDEKGGTVKYTTFSGSCMKSICKSALGLALTTILF